MSVHRHSKITDIDLGLLQMQILWLLNRKPAHGYELMKNLSDLKTTEVTQSALYPALQRLEEMGLVKNRKFERKKIYHLTLKGKKVMKNTCLEFCKTFQGIFKDFVCGKCR